MDWDYVKPVVAGQVRHLVGILAGALIGVGALQSSQAQAFDDIGAGIVMWALVGAWSWWQKHGQNKVAAELDKLKGNGGATVTPIKAAT